MSDLSLNALTDLPLGIAPLPQMYMPGFAGCKSATLQFYIEILSLSLKTARGTQSSWTVKQKL